MSPAEPTHLIPDVPIDGGGRGTTGRLDSLAADRHDARFATSGFRPSYGVHMPQGARLALVDIAPRSKLREHDLGTFDRVDAAVVSHPEAPGIRSSRE